MLVSKGIKEERPEAAIWLKRIFVFVCSRRLKQTEGAPSRKLQLGSVSFSRTPPICVALSGKDHPPVLRVSSFIKDTPNLGGFGSLVSLGVFLADVYLYHLGAQPASERASGPGAFGPCEGLRSHPSQASRELGRAGWRCSRGTEHRPKWFIPVIFRVTLGSMRRFQLEGLQTRSRSCNHHLGWLPAEFSLFFRDCFLMFKINPGFFSVDSNPRPNDVLSLACAEIGAGL